ncbi:MAG: DUF1559 domain-containing protein [Planctomycetaceae bacterium]
MESLPTTRCCPICSARLLPAETVCNKCSNNTRLPPRKSCPWCAEPLPRGMVICRHCFADLAVPEPEPVHCETCGAPVSATALACIRCGTPTSTTGRTAIEPREEATHDSAVTQSKPPQHAPHREQDLLPERTQPRSSSDASSPEVLAEFDLSVASVVVGCLVLIAEVALGLWLVQHGVLPIPGGWLDLRVTAWVVAHSVTCIAALGVGAVAAGLGRRSVRRRVWSSGAVAFAAVVPSLALAWNGMHLVAGLWRLVAGQGSNRTLSTLTMSRETSDNRLLSRPEPHSPWWTWLTVFEVVTALLVSIGLIWPAPWASALSPGLLATVEGIRAASPWLVGALAVLGIGHLLWAAFGWYWETYEEGGLVTWLSPVVLLAPLLAYFSTALLTGLGADIAGRQGISLSAALRDSVLLWGFLSLYGAYYLLTSWSAMRGFATLAVIGYVLCGPMLVTGWEAGRRQTHRLECGHRLAALAVGLRRYAEVYGELPPPVIRREDGTPLHSWRVLVLPFIGEKKLHQQFDLQRTWDSPVNRPLQSARPELFACGELAWNDRESTLVSAVVGEPTFFPPSGGVARSELDRQGAERLLLLEVSEQQRRPWTAPTDVRLDELDFDHLRSIHSGSLQAVRADGTPVDLRPPRSPQDNDMPIDQRFWRPAASVPRTASQ